MPPVCHKLKLGYVNIQRPLLELRVGRCNAILATPKSPHLAQSDLTVEQLLLVLFGRSWHTAPLYTLSDNDCETESEFYA
ncbi:MAG: hypothetical protein V7731_19700 [Amphritea sp.]